MSQTISETVAYDEVVHSEWAPSLLQLGSVTKRFPGVLALDRIDFDLRPGEVHVLFGENGAGKSTLINIIAGALRPTEGTIKFRGRDVKLHSVQDARELGISAVFQEFSLVPDMTVEENLYLGAETSAFGLLRKGELHQRAEEMLSKLGFPLRAGQKAGSLSRAEQQMVEIAKAFRSDLSVLILDEPTASLTERETERLFALIEHAKADGVGIIYITHRMGEIKRIADRITVLRDGKHIATIHAESVTDERLVQLMTGRVIDQVFPKINHRPSDVILSVEGLKTSSGTVKNVSIAVRRGEIVGLAGLVGAGKSNLARACFGLETIAGGNVIFDNQNTTGLKPRKMLDRGMFYVPPDRREEGLVMIRSVRENVVLPSLGLKRFSGRVFLRRGAEKQAVRELTKSLNLQPHDPERRVDHYSGGNQQKVLLARTLTRDVKLFIFDEPTVGVDVGARVIIYEFIRDLCESGAAVLLVSSDLPEILHLSHRAYVMYRGMLNVELQGSEITEENVLRRFFEQDVDNGNDDMGNGSEFQALRQVAQPVTQDLEIKTR
jgi:ribose transport system ATP-binding protein